ncbi:MAG: hypothetical protein KDB84_10880, partial [Flavobacteriales bacterium]|nr:hypothetical protein [Flavobacteriales bacterium]
PGELYGFDPSTGEAIHTPPEEPPVIGVIDEVIEFAVPGLQQLVSKGTELHHELRGHVHVTPVGVQPLHATEGWLLVRMGDRARAYSYSLPLVRMDVGTSAAIRTRFVSSYSLGISFTYEHIKSDLIERYRHLPTPATFAVESDRDLPHMETVMPIARSIVSQRISQGDQ